MDIPTEADRVSYVFGIDGPPEPSPGSWVCLSEWKAEKILPQYEGVLVMLGYLWQTAMPDYWIKFRGRRQRQCEAR